MTNGAGVITCLKYGIPAFMCEMGEGGKVETAYVEAAKKGILNVMRFLHMLEGQAAETKGQVLITKRRFLRIDHGGLIKMQVKPGDVVKAGETLLDSHYYGEEVEHLAVQADSYIIGIRENPVVNTGDRIAFVGTEWKDWQR